MDRQLFQACSSDSLFVNRLLEASVARSDDQELRQAVALTFSLTVDTRLR